MTTATCWGKGCPDGRCTKLALHSDLWNSSCGPFLLCVAVVALQTPQQEPWSHVATAILPGSIAQSLQLLAQRSLQRCNSHRQFVCRGMSEATLLSQHCQVSHVCGLPLPGCLSAPAQHKGAWVGVAVCVAASGKIVVPNAGNNVLLRPQSWYGTLPITWLELTTAAHTRRVMAMQCRNLPKSGLNHESTQVLRTLITFCCCACCCVRCCPWTAAWAAGWPPAALSRPQPGWCAAPQCTPSGHAPATAADKHTQRRRVRNDQPAQKLHQTRTTSGHMRPPLWQPNAVQCRHALHPPAPAGPAAVHPSP